MAIAKIDLKTKVQKDVGRRTESDFSFSTRTLNCFHNAEINTLEDLCSKTPIELLRIKNFSRKSLDNVVTTLSLLGLKLKEG